MTVGLLFLAAAVGTYLIRLSGIVLLGGDRELHPRLRHALTLVAPAAMAAIIANSLLLDHGQWRSFGAWHLAALVAIGVALWRRTTGWPLLIGALAFAGFLLLGW